MKWLTIGLLATSLYSTATIATPCNVNINHGIVIDPSHIRILNQDRTYIQINAAQQLFIEGREITLSASQQALLKEYSTEIRKQVPEIVSIVLDGLEIGLKSVNKVIGGLTGENSESHQKIQEKFSEVQMRLHKRFSHSDQNYFIAPQDFDNFDELFTGEFELALEEIISASIGTILSAVEQVLSDNNNEYAEVRSESGGEQRVNTLDQRLASLGQDLKLEMGSRVTALGIKAEQFCQGLIKLNTIESQLKQQIPQLSEFELIDTHK